MLRAAWGKEVNAWMPLAAVAALAEVATADRLTLLGESLGAAMAAPVAVESPSTALVLKSPFPSLEAVAAVHLPIPPHPAATTRSSR